MKSDSFPYLVVGLAQFLEKEDRCYPYPDALRYGLNHLSLGMLSHYPKTLHGLIQLFAKPLREWWPGDLPSDFEPTAPLLIEDNELSVEAENYLEKMSEQDNLAFQDSLSRIEGIIENRKFRQLWEYLRNKSLEDMNGAQRDYVTLRRFLIEHPYTPLTDISQVFSETKYINTTQVHELYRKTNEIKDLLQHPNSNGLQVFWLCEHCGPLRVKYGQLESIKRSACGKHCPRYRGGWKEIQPTSQLCVLRKGIHLRVHLPGIPELAIFKWLEERQQEYPELLKEVVLWPRIDIYDLQIRFVDSTWAVDVKDRKEPNRLGESLTGLYREGDLRWDRGFYVYPSYREKQRLGYSDEIRLQAVSKLKDIEVVSDEVFKDQVISKLKSLKKGRP